MAVQFSYLFESLFSIQKNYLTKLPNYLFFLLLAFDSPDFVKKNPLKRSSSMPLMPDDMRRIGKGGKCLTYTYIQLEPWDIIVHYLLWLYK